MRPIQDSGFASPPQGGRPAFAGLLATLGLAAGTAIAATVVSIGIARADTIGGIVDNDVGMFALALLLGLIFVGMGGITALMLPTPRRRD
ncbi:MAG TPA: hypothetical protein VFB45_21650 [Pseudolabrys sp.]|nr:hypothetical protein [Pseudolabrys sp.]